MDVLSLTPGRIAPIAGGLDDDPFVERLRRWLTALRVDVVPRAVGGAGGAGGASSAEVRRGGLFAYTAASIVVGLGLLAWTSSGPVAATLDPGLPGTLFDGPDGGLLLWVGFGLMGSLRVLRAPGGGAFFTFHLPFIGAAMVLGGPTAGAWVAFLSTIERRELESQSWYGILANHSVLVIGAVTGGMTTWILAGLLGATSLTSGAGFVATISGILVLTLVTTAMAAVTIILRDEMSPREFLGVLIDEFGRITALEVALAWVLCLAYLVVGWWAPLAIGAFVLMVWNNDPPVVRGENGVLSETGFEHKMEGGLGKMRRGLIPGATVLSIGIDDLVHVRDRYGFAVRDEVLLELGRRLAVQARRPATDLAGSRGDHGLALFLAGLADQDTAMRRANDVHVSMTGPVATTVGPVSVGASIGVVVIASTGTVPSTGTVMRHADQAMHRAEDEGGGTHLFDPDEPGPHDDGRGGSRR
jgi:diguanylate cyclase (GGDEF)-like protein